jgi:hypothetical protein
LLADPAGFVTLSRGVELPGLRGSFSGVLELFSLTPNEGYATRTAYIGVMSDDPNWKVTPLKVTQLGTPPVLTLKDPATSSLEIVGDKDTTIKFTSNANWTVTSELDRVGRLKLDNDGGEMSDPDNVGFAPDASASELLEYHINISPVPTEDREDPEAAGTPIVGKVTLSTLLPAESGLVDKSLEITVSRPAATHWADFSFALEEDGILGDDDEVHTSANTNASWSLTSSGAYASKEAGWDGTKTLSLKLPESPVARFVTVVATVPVGEPIERRFVQRGENDTDPALDSYLLFDKIEGEGLEGEKIPASGGDVTLFFTGTYEGNVIVKVKDASTGAEVARGDAPDGETWSVALSIPPTTEPQRAITFEVETSGVTLFMPGTMLPSYTQE